MKSSATLSVKPFVAVYLVAFFHVAQGSVAFGRGDSFNNGGGLSEANIAFGYTQIESYSSMCQALATCSNSAGETILLQAISDSAGQERAGSSPIFKSPADVPGFFGTEPNELAFRTEGEIGAPIYYNLEKIYTRDPISGAVKALPLNDCVGILFQALTGHHADLARAVDVKMLANRLSQSIRSRRTSYSLDNGAVSGGAMQILQIDPRRFPTIIISDKISLYDLTRSIRDKFLQNVASAEIDDFSDFQIINARWESGQSVGAGFIYPFTGEILTLRQDGRHIRCQWNFNAFFSIDVQRDAWLYKDEQSQLSTMGCHVE